MNPHKQTLLDLDPICAGYSESSAALETATAELERDLAAVRDLHADRIKALAVAVAEKEAAVRAWVDAHRESFESPRSQILHGVEVGLQKVPGAVEFDDESLVIAALEKMYREEPEVLAALVKVEKSVRKDALRALPTDRFMRAGCRVDGAGDSVFVRRTAGDVERILKAGIATLVKAMLDQGNPKPKRARK